jgi:hypothetical protein
VSPPSTAAPTLEAIGAIGWVLPEEYQGTTEESLRKEPRRDGLSKAQIDEFIARGDWWGLDVSVKQYAGLSDGGRVFDPVYLGVWFPLPLELSEAEIERGLETQLDAAFRTEMTQYEDWIA